MKRNTKWIIGLGALAATGVGVTLAVTHKAKASTVTPAPGRTIIPIVWT